MEAEKELKGRAGRNTLSQLSEEDDCAMQKQSNERGFYAHQTKSYRPAVAEPPSPNHYGEPGAMAWQGANLFESA